MNKRITYISLFGILYFIVALSSCIHAFEFFGLANNDWMAVILSFAFEVGQAAVLFSLLTSKKDRNRFMPWLLMIIFTLVQILGNVYSSYKYIVENSSPNLRFFKEPVFIWTDLPDDITTVIITYIVGGILPLGSLLLTSMITNYLNDEEDEKKSNETPVIDMKRNEEKPIETEEDGKNDEPENLEEEEPIIEEENTDNNEELSEDKEPDDRIEETDKGTQGQDVENIINEDRDLKPSHMINL